MGWLYTKKGRWEIAEVERKVLLVGIVKMILWTIKGLIGRWKLTKVEERIFDGDCGVDCMHKSGFENEEVPIVL